MRRGLAAVALVLALAGCSDPPPSGTVTDKQHTSMWVQMIYCGKGCFTPIIHPEQWELCITNGADSGCVDVDEDAWNRYHVGDHYPAPVTP